MQSFLGAILSFLLLYKYAALFLVIFVSSFGVPVPTVGATLAAAAFAGEGYLSWPLVFATCFVASVLGDYTVYWFALILKEKATATKTFRKALPSERLQIVSNKFNSHPIAVIVFSRFTNLTTFAVNILAGFFNFPFRRFGFWDALGEFLTTAVYISLGYIFGYNWVYISDLLGKAGLILVLILILLLYKPIKKLFRIAKHA